MGSLLFQSLSAIGGGIALVEDPSGGNMGMPVDMLAGSPFRDFMVPGLILLVVLGVFPLVVFVAVWRRQCWAWTAALLIGLAIVVWILVQISIVGYSSRPPLQLVYGLLGVIIVLLALWPRVKPYLCGNADVHSSVGLRDALSISSPGHGPSGATS